MKFLLFELKWRICTEKEFSPLEITLFVVSNERTILRTLHFNSHLYALYKNSISSLPRCTHIVLYLHFHIAFQIPYQRLIKDILDKSKTNNDDSLFKNGCVHRLEM